MGGRMHRRCDETVQAAPHGRIVFFAEFLAASKRDAHIAGVRGDAVAAKALGLRGMVSQDSVRRALAAMVPEASEPWIRSVLDPRFPTTTSTPWRSDLANEKAPPEGSTEQTQNTDESTASAQMILVSRWALLWFRMEKDSSKKANQGSPQSLATFNYCEMFFRRRAITPARQTPTPIIR